MTTHIMLDLETWGTEPGCDIRSIGACVFDPVTGYVAGHERSNHDSVTPNTFYIATKNPTGYWGHGSARDRFFTLPESETNKRKYDLKRDPKTVQWWSEQSDEAQAAFADPVDLREALMRFAEWLNRQSAEIHIYGMPIWTPPTDIRLWSHGPAFDPPILAAAYRAVGLPVPWHYRAPRDTRTAFDMAGIDDHSGWLKEHPGPLGIPHHALDDAICQARAVCGAWHRVAGWRKWDDAMSGQVVYDW